MSGAEPNAVDLRANNVVAPSTAGFVVEQTQAPAPTIHEVYDQDLDVLAQGSRTYWGDFFTLLIGAALGMVFDAYRIIEAVIRQDPLSDESRVKGIIFIVLLIAALATGLCHYLLSSGSKRKVVEIRNRPRIRREMNTR